MAPVLGCQPRLINGHSRTRDGYGKFVTNSNMSAYVIRATGLYVVPGILSVYRGSCTGNRGPDGVVPTCELRARVNNRKDEL